MTKEDLILERLERIENKQDVHGEKLFEMHGEVSGLKVRASIFGLLGGLIVALLARLGFHN
jgi:hypothetical protein